ncbi:MAG: hypothetical protein IPF52_03125 [Saprospiraceae bacterium]|nr:hypothetical protein [Saprospiraceae bacterium]
MNQRVMPCPRQDTNQRKRLSQAKSSSEQTGFFSDPTSIDATRSGALRFQYSQSFLDTGYKELTIPASDEGGFRLEKCSSLSSPEKVLYFDCLTQP